MSRFASHFEDGARPDRRHRPRENVRSTSVPTPKFLASSRPGRPGAFGAEAVVASCARSVTHNGALPRVLVVSSAPAVDAAKYASNLGAETLMDVTWLGHGCFRLRGRNAAVVTDPYPPAIGLKLQRLDADLVTISHGHDNHSYAQAVREAYEIRGPGEYEVAGVAVVGVPTYHDTEKGARHGRNTVYLIEIDDVRVCHLGDLGHRLDDAEAETLSSADVLLVPVGGHSVINASQAAEVVRQLEPRYVVPMHYAIPGLKLQLDPIDRFLKEMGLTAGEPQPKLSVSASSGEYETKLVLLEPRAEPKS